VETVDSSAAEAVRIPLLQVQLVERRRRVLHRALSVEEPLPEEPLPEEPLPEEPLPEEPLPEEPLPEAALKLAAVVALQMTTYHSDIC
jgi:hypothetical protein